MKVNKAITAALIEKGEVTEAHRAEPLSENRIEVDRVVKQGDVIAVDGQSFEVIETPGHSDCSLSFHEPAEKILVVSDATGEVKPDGSIEFTMENRGAEGEDYIPTRTVVKGVRAQDQ